MNRDFLIDTITPATARKIVSVMQCTRSYIDPKILELSQSDLIETDQNGRVKDLMQYIADYDYRCIIPVEQDMSVAREGIALSIPPNQRVLFFDDPVNWNVRLRTKLTPYSPDGTARFQFLSHGAPALFMSDDIRGLLQNRDMMIVAKIHDAQYMEQYYQWIGKAFQKIVLYCEVEKQHSLAFKREFTDSVLAAASIIHPHLKTVVGYLNNYPRQKSYPLAGATKLFLRDEEKK